MGSEETHVFQTTARRYAYAKIEFSVRTYLAYVRIFRKIEHAYDTFCTQTWIFTYTYLKRNNGKHDVNVLQSGKKNCLVECNCRDKQFSKLFTFSAVNPL